MLRKKYLPILPTHTLCAYVKHVLLIVVKFQLLRKIQMERLKAHVNSMSKVSSYCYHFVILSMNLLNDALQSARHVSCFVHMRYRDYLLLIVITTYGILPITIMERVILTSMRECV